MIESKVRFDKRIRLSIPDVGEKELAYVREAFESNWLSTTGPQVDALEHAFSAWLGLPSVALNSGTAAIHLALKILGIREGDEVVCPTLTFVATCNPILYERGVPVFVDSEKVSWNLNGDLFERFLKRRRTQNRLPKAVIVVHILGQSANMDPIVELCQAHDLWLLEDAAQSLGAQYRGQSVGTFGHVAAFSFNGNKIITGAGGGILASKRKAWVEKARYWSSQACDPGPEYLHSEVGYNYRMSPLVATLVREQLPLLPKRIEQRRAVFARYRHAFADLPGIEPQPEVEYETRGQRSEVGGDVGGQRSEVGGQLVRRLVRHSLGVGGSAGEGGRSEDRGQMSPLVHNAWSMVHSPSSLVPAGASLHTRWLSCFLVDEKKFGMSAGDLIRFLDAANIESRPVWKPMHTQPLYKKYECIGGEVAEDLNRRGICLPSSSCLTEEEQQFVIERVREAHIKAVESRRSKVPGWRAER